MLLRVLGAWCRSQDHRILSYHLALQLTGCESRETTVCTRRLLWAGVLIRMDNRRLPRRIMVRILENPGWRGRGGKEKEWTDCIADDLWLFGIGVEEGWKTVALNHGKWWKVVMEGGRTFMATWRTEEERVSEVRRNKRETQEGDKTPIAPGVTAGQLRRFRAALIGPLLPSRGRAVVP